MPLLADSYGFHSVRGPCPCRSINSTRPDVSLTQHTSPLDVIRGKSVLVLIDAENLAYSARQIGYRASFGAIADILRSIPRACALHAFFSRLEGDTIWENYFASRGYLPHPRNIEVVKTHSGIRKRANADNDLIFHAGMLSSSSRFDVVVIGSGDGDLVTDLGRLIGQMKGAVLTMSLPGSTSWRLNAAVNPDIRENIEVGLDCLHKRNGDHHPGGCAN